MSPFVHGRIYPETESSGLVSYSLRVLVDPRTVRHQERSILDIDTLRVYLNDIESPCRIVLMLPARSPGTFEHEYDFMENLGGEVLPSASIVVPDAAAAFPEDAHSGALAFASTALIGDTDIVLSEDLASQADIVTGFRSLHIPVLDAQGVKRSCELFVRGHEIPWSFALPAWGMPWGPFYAMVDPDIQMMEQFRGLAIRRGAAADVREHIRSLGLNRWSAIAYTRDKLLFYLIQRRRAKREKLEKQDFTFELAYYLNTYFLLFWGALDQVSWIVNGICNLGFKAHQWKQVGVAKKDFVKRLAVKDPEMATEFQNAEFLRWLNVLKRTRHHVAHKGTAMLSPLYEKPDVEPSEEEIDREIEQWQEWRELASRWPPVFIETFRPNFRAKWLARNYKQMSDAAFVIPGVTDTAILFPLENIEWEYEQFRRVVLGVARKCMTRLEEYA